MSCENGDRSPTITGRIGTWHAYPLTYTHTGSFSWCKATSTVLPPRYEHAAFAVGDDVYVFAGAQENGPMNDLWKYDQG